MRIPDVVHELWTMGSTKDVSHKTSKHAAVLVKRGKVLAYAMNQLGSRSRGSGYSDCTIHAEKNVIKALGDLRQLKGASMYVTRYSAHSQASMPCEECQIFLRKCFQKYGLRCVYYTCDT